MKNTLLFFLLLAGTAVHAQTVLLSVDRKEESKTSDIGPNLKKFTHFYIRGGMLVSSDKPGARIVYGTSVNLAFGVRKKYKFSSVYSLGVELEYQYSDYKFKQVEGKLIPDTIINIMGRLDYSSLVFGIFDRINFDPKRGNYLGKFLDLGISGEWHYSIKSITKNDGADGTQVKTITSSLGYTNNVNAKLFARLGLSHLSLFVTYQLLDVFKPEYNYPELPKMVVGIDIAVF